MSLHRLDRLSDLAAAEWDALIPGDSPFLRHAFLSALEDSGSLGPRSGWRAEHLLHYENDQLIAALPAYRKWHSYGEYVFDHSWADACRRAGIAYYPKLLVAVPFSPVSGPRLLAKTPEDGRELIACLPGYAEAEELSSVHVNFTDPVADALLASHPEWLQRIGCQYHWQNRDLDAAERQALNALAIHPEDLSCNLYLGYIGLTRGTTEDLLAAEARFRGMEQQDDFRTDLGLAEALERLGVIYDESARAIASGRRTTQAPDPEARVIELETMAREAWAESVSRYHEVLELKQNEVKAINGLQRVHALRGEYEQSLVWSNRLIDLVQIDLTYYQAQLDRPGISDVDEARLRTRMSNSVDLAERTYLLGADMLRELGRNQTALEYLEEASDLAPETPDTWTRRAQVLMDLARYGEAIVCLDTYLRLSPEEFDHPDVQAAYDLRTQCETAERERAFQERLDALEAGA